MVREWLTLACLSGQLIVNLEVQQPQGQKRSVPSMVNAHLPFIVIEYDTQSTSQRSGWISALSVLLSKVNKSKADNPDQGSWQEIEPKTAT